MVNWWLRIRGQSVMYKEQKNIKETVKYMHMHNVLINPVNFYKLTVVIYFVIANEYSNSETLKTFLLI